MVDAATRAASIAEARKSRLRGIGCMLVAVGAFAFMDSLLKFLTEHYPTMQVSAMRGFASLPFILVPLLFTRRFAELKPVRWKLHLMRGVLSVLVLGTFVYAIRVLSLADAYSIFLSAPLIVTALSVPILGEKVGWHRWFAIGIGLCGVMVMLRPSASGLMTVGALAAFVSAVSYAVSAVSVRVLTKTDSNTSVVFWSMAIMTFISTLLALRDWESIRVEHLGAIAATGAIGALAVTMLTQAFRSAPASAIAPFEYTALLWGVGIDWLVWDTLPDSRVYLGGSIVIVSGLYVIWRESRRQIEPIEAATSGANAT
ncbi:MAG TPA: DMT family transporter [Steroidobacteraceae bacterium]|nr:DMT family transporter [Steroidobacteraceae bacterium]